MGDLPLVHSQNSNIAFPKRYRRRDEIIWEQTPQTCDVYHDSSQTIAFQESSHPRSALHQLNEDMRPRRIHDFVFDQHWIHEFSSRVQRSDTNTIRTVNLEGFSLRYGRSGKKSWLLVDTLGLRVLPWLQRISALPCQQKKMTPARDPKQPTHFGVHHEDWRQVSDPVLWWLTSLHWKLPKVPDSMAVVGGG